MADVRIEGVRIPAELRQSYIPYNLHELVLRNDENCDIEIEWQAHSSVTGKFDGGIALVPGPGLITILRQYVYDQKPGLVDISYVILCNGVLLDVWSGTVNVTS